jgi:catechol 2,3-dioxygenase-like lactoylglutathione lyase family enzyme
MFGPTSGAPVTMLDMAMTTRVLSVSVPVADQDRALEFYRDVLGCEVRLDMEPWPGARLIEVVPPGSSVGLRLGTTDAEAAHARLREAGAQLHNEEVLRMQGSAPMFFFADPYGNGLVYIQEDEPTGE